MEDGVESELAKTSVGLDLLSAFDALLSRQSNG